jgi:glycosyltransferase involved in cell wall biosynthesis
MSSAGTDIIIPIWNRPFETRQCLAALVEHADDARLIIMDPGSDPETEQILHEFAEFLDDRMILLRTERALGFVETLNRGLALVSAPLAIALRTSSFVTSGWLEPLRAATLRADAGIIVPRLAPCGSAMPRRTGNDSMAVETSHGSFAALGITARLYQRIGGLDGGLDGDVWCLKDYSRRASRAGFRTLCVDGPPVMCRTELAYGSPERRERILMESMAAYRSRWGEERAYCLCLSRDPGREAIDRIFAVILSAAREGHRMFVLAPFRAHRMIVAAGLHRCHVNISVERLSRCFPARAVRSALARLRGKHPEVKLVTGTGGLSDPGGEQGVPFSELENH